MCYIINTAEYCRETVNPLGDSVAKTLDKPFSDEIDMTAEEDEFSGVITKALQSLVAGVGAAVEEQLAMLVRVRLGAGVERTGADSALTRCAGRVRDVCREPSHRRRILRCRGGSFRGRVSLDRDDALAHTRNLRPLKHNGCGTTGAHVLGYGGRSGRPVGVRHRDLHGAVRLRPARG